MNEQFLRQIAERFGLTVLKRITTGNDRAHFATFELSGVRAADAWPAVFEKARSDGRTNQHAVHFDRLTTVDNPEHSERGQLYIECQCVWCEPI